MSSLLFLVICKILIASLTTNNSFLMAKKNPLWHRTTSQRNTIENPVFRMSRRKITKTKYPSTGQWTSHNKRCLTRCRSYFISFFPAFLDMNHCKAAINLQTFLNFYQLSSHLFAKERFRFVLHRPFSTVFTSMLQGLNQIKFDPPLVNP